MPQYKVTWVFDAGKTGWTETMYHEAETIQLGMADARRWAAARAKLLGRSSQVSINYIRVQDQASPYPVLSQPVSYTSEGDAAVDQVDMPWNGVLCLMNADNSKARRSMVLRGVPDRINAQTWYRPTSGTQWNQDFKDWVAEVITGGWELKVLNRAAAPLQTIQSVATNGLGQLVVTSPGHGLLHGQLVTFYRVKSQMACIKGTHRISAATADTFTIPAITFGRIYFIRGQFRINAYTYLGISNVELQGARRKLTGRPIGLLRGRRKGCKR